MCEGLLLGDPGDFKRWTWCEALGSAMGGGLSRGLWSPGSSSAFLAPWPQEEQLCTAWCFHNYVVPQGQHWNLYNCKPKQHVEELTVSGIWYGNESLTSFVTQWPGMGCRTTSQGGNWGWSCHTQLCASLQAFCGNCFELPQ